MINAADLRLGNWVHHTKEWSTINNGPFDTPGFDFQWDDRHWYMLGECTLSLDVIEPIPLSAEWLERFGLEAKETPSLGAGTQYWRLGDKLKIVDSASMGGFCFCHGGNTTELLYVHQLQNLTYAITNTELTLNNK